MVTKLSPESIIAAVREADGSVVTAAKRLGVRRQSIYKHAQRHPEVLEAIQEIREDTIDRVEGVLIERALAGEPWAVCFYLKTQAKHRGYTERQERITANVSIDVTKLSDEQLRRLAAGEMPNNNLLTIEGEYVEV